MVSTLGHGLTYTAPLYFCSQVSQKWAELLAEEFMQQGDLETQLGIPTPPHMNRRLATSNSLALNTIDNFVAPTLSLLSTFLPRVGKPTPSVFAVLHRAW